MRETQLPNDGTVFKSELAFASILLRVSNSFFFFFSHSSMMEWDKRAGSLSPEENISEAAALGKRRRVVGTAGVRARVTVRRNTVWS